MYVLLEPMKYELRDFIDKEKPDIKMIFERA